MSRRDLEPLLHDILTAGDRISDYLANMSLEAYVVDATAHDVAERNFITIGEALMQLMRIAPDVEIKIPAARDAIAFRHVLTHGYRLIDHRRVWKIAHEGLPLLHSQCRALLGELPA